LLPFGSQQGPVGRRFPLTGGVAPFYLADVAYRWRDHHQLTVDRLITAAAALLILPMAIYSPAVLHWLRYLRSDFSASWAGSYGGVLAWDPSPQERSGEACRPHRATNEIVAERTERTASPISVECRLPRGLVFELAKRRVPPVCHGALALLAVWWAWMGTSSPASCASVCR
jgi:hypothetical protein